MQQGPYQHSGNPQYPNQPYQPYPQQPGMPSQEPYYPQQPPQPKKKGKGLLFGAVVVIVALFACIGIGIAASHGTGSNAPVNNSNTSSPVQANNQSTGKWTITHTFSSNGEKKTSTFAAPDDWKIQWKCNPSSSYGGSYNVIVMVYNSHGPPHE